MAVITTGAHPKALWPGIHAWFGRSYTEHPEEYPDLFDMETSDKAYEEDVEISGFGLAPVKTQGGSISYEAEQQGYTKRYTHVAYAKGYIVTHEELQDNLYEVVSRRRAKMLAFSMRQTKEIIAANVYNNATTSGFTGGDGVVLLSASHPTQAGNQSNLLATAADLSEASIEDMAIQIMQAKNAKGLNISLMPRSLHIAPQNAFEATRILKSTLQNDTANNAVNAIRSMGLFPDGAKVNHYFTDADAWFVRTNCPSGMTMYTREARSFSQDNDFDTKNAKAAAYERYSVGWTDWRSVYGTPGA
jgi:hypothetical protein